MGLLFGYLGIFSFNQGNLLKKLIGDQHSDIKTFFILREGKNKIECECKERDW